MKEIIYTIIGGVGTYFVVSAIAKAREDNAKKSAVASRYDVEAGSEQANMLYDQEMEFMM